MSAMKFIGGRAVLGQWGLGDGVKDVEEAINNTMASCEFFAELEFEHDTASLKLNLALSDDENTDEEPNFRISLDRLLYEAMENADSKKQFMSFLQNVQEAIDRIMVSAAEYGE